MPSKKPAAQPTRSPSGFVLRYVGPGTFNGVAARDLTAADLARLAYVRAMSFSGPDGIRPDRAQPDPDLVKAITAELTGSGLYELEG